MEHDSDLCAGHAVLISKHTLSLWSSPLLCNAISGSHAGKLCCVCPDASLSSRVLKAACIAATDRGVYTRSNSSAMFLLDPGMPELALHTDSLSLVEGLMGSLTNNSACPYCMCRVAPCSLVTVCTQKPMNAAMKLWYRCTSGVPI